MEKKITVGLIGLGKFGKNYLRELQTLPQVKLKRVVSQTGRSFSNHGDTLKGIETSTDVNDIFKDPEIEAVFVITPAATHVKYVKMALKAGKHVFCEKPLVMTPKETEEIKSLLKKSKKKFMLGHQYVYNSHVEFVKNEVQAGRIGIPQFIHMEQLMEGYEGRTTSCISEMATHELAIIDYLFSPAKITSVKGDFVSLRSSGKPDLASINLTFDTGLRAMITVSWCMPRRVRGFTVVGLGGLKDAIYLNDRPPESVQIYRGITPTDSGVAKNNPLKSEIEKFFACIELDVHPWTGFLHAEKISKWLNQIEKKL